VLEMMNLTPDIVQVVPHDDYTVSVFFCDGKTVLYDVKPKLKQGVFQKLQDLSFFMESCTIMNDTLAWDVAGNGDPSACIDIDPETLYALPAIEDRLETVS
jgi:hypothetical protein